ncbi:glycoside hydrolase domain-containing protein [Streptomyces sp. NPDC059002]|uniref:glycoside hydrolase domain-containing protein n=1 Tax=Streptomyces sp. NPDC059002 TaxID=3346690 RepID=UPI0036D050E0
MADEKVLEAQRWVNATYGGVAGYERCPETGRTGWSTMNALIMGLQHELGISPVVAGFGPTTLAKVAALGEIGFGWDKNRNIVAILQHGLFCKGYWAVEPESYGWYTGVTRQAVKDLRANMGIPEGEGTVSAKIFKCILNMDAYVVVAGGTDKIRGIQQWLNGRYWQKDAYGIGPCDGIYSRDVQKSLMIAIQYVLGIASPNGNFGPATQAGLRANNLGPGSTGVFVELFSAACVFNEPIGDYRTNQRDTYDGALTDYVKAFQRFSQISKEGEANYGRGDYTTWAQLLVSMGDADRPASASDTRFEITASRAKWLHANGYRIVGRYLYDPPGSDLDKEIKPGELKTIFDNGLRVFPIYQDNARRLVDFTYTHGYEHALNAHKLASDYGFNRGTVIYFAVDYDATQDEIDSAIVPYFQGVSAGLASQGKKYVHGVYGSRNVCTNVTNKTFARFSFVSGMSWGFSGNLGFTLPTNWSFNQIKEFKVSNGSDSFDLDRDVWRERSDPGTGSIKDPAGPADAFIAYIQRLYDVAVGYTGSDRSPSQLVMEYIRHAEYGNKDWQNELGWWFLIGGYDEGFVKHANDRGMTIMKNFTDPYTGYELGAEHLMATANGHFLTPQESNQKSANGGDVAGWGGDLMTFFAEWRNSEEQYASGKAFCEAKLAVPTVASSFGFADLIEDADGYRLARAVRGGKTIVQAVKDHYDGGGGLRRFNTYFEDRWGTAENCKFAAHNVLTASDITLGLGRKQLITMAGAMLPSVLQNLPGGADKLDSFEQGFVSAILRRTGMENRLADTYRANHEKYLHAARTRESARAREN